MRHTQDIVVARLRELGRRWRAASAPGEPLGAGAGGGPAKAAPLGAAEGEPRGGGEGAGVGAASSEVGASPADDRARTPWGRVGGLLAALAVGMGLVAVFLTWPRPVAGGPSDLPGMGPASAAPSAGPAGWASADPFATPTPTTPSSILVHVAGEVRRPGVVRLPAGSRLIDAVEAAGGLERGGSIGGANLARVLSDGERVEVGADVPTPAPGAAGAGPSGADPGGAGGAVDLNSATAQQLDALPGIGPVTAAKILAWRAEHGRFTVVDELAEVSGIGPKTLEEIRPHVRV